MANRGDAEIYVLHRFDRKRYTSRMGVALVTNKNKQELRLEIRGFVELGEGNLSA